MLCAVTLVKVAGILSLLILGWVAVTAARARREAEPGEGPKRDRLGETLLRGFTLMLALGVGSVFAISFGEVLQAL